MVGLGTADGREHPVPEGARVSVVVPVYDEGDTAVPPLRRLLEAVTDPCEVLVVYDSPDDSTVPYLERLAGEDARLVPVHNTRGPGPAEALRFGFDRATAPVVVVTMADGCDDPDQIHALTRLVERGAVIAAASRYARGGQQIGGPVLKGLMSRFAGVSLYWFGRVGTRDATNSFKAYDAEFVRSVGIEASRGFEMGIELVAKARRRRLPVAEIPTIWLDRNLSGSNFQLRAWLWQYLRWYLYALGLGARRSPAAG